MLRLELRVGLHQVHRALPRLKPADEQDVDLPVVVFGKRLGARVELHVDAVRDDLVITREVRRDEVACGTRDGDPRIELVQVPVTDRPARPGGKGEPAEGVERRDLRAPRGVEYLHREEWNERLVVMDDV